MTGKEKKSIYEAVEGRYSDPTYANEASILTREVIKISEEWLRVKSLLRLLVEKREKTSKFML